MEGLDGSLDGGLTGVVLNLHHSLDDRLDEELVLGIHSLGGFSDLLGERNEGVLDLDEGERSEVSIVVVGLSFLEFFNSESDNLISIAVFSGGNLVKSFSIGKSFFGSIESISVVLESLLSIL